MKTVFGSKTTFHTKVALSFVIPSEAEGSAVPRTFLGKIPSPFLADRNQTR
jgi:hypothetical protein